MLVIEDIYGDMFIIVNNGGIKIDNSMNNNT